MSLWRRLAAAAHAFSRATPFSRIPVRHPAGITPLRSMPSIPLLGSLFSSTTPAKQMSYPDKRTDDEWRAVLNPEQFRVLREKGTERPNTGAYNKHDPSAGVYGCAGCSAPLYKVSDKFDSGCGWPAYFDSIPGAVQRFEDRALGMLRTEIVCANCGGHLGHVFKGEGFGGEKDERHCVNSVSLKFSEEDKVGGERKGEGGDEK